MNDPSYALLNDIGNRKLGSDDDIAALVRTVVEAWEHPGRVAETAPGLWVFYTGGLSGNEDVIEALHGNLDIFAMVKSLSVYGGLHIFAITKDAQDVLGALYDTISDWAWAGGVHKLGSRT